MANDFIHWRNATNNYNPESEPTVVLPEQFRGNTKIQPSVPVPQSGRIRATEKEYGNRYPQAQDFGWKQPVYNQKPADPTLQELQEKLSEVESTLIEAGERFEAEKDQPNTKVAGLEAEVARLTTLLTEAQQSLDAAKAEGTPLDRISRSIDKAEKSVSGLAGATIQAAVSQDSLRVFSVEAKHLPKSGLDSLRIRHELAVRHLLPQHFIALSGNTLDNQGVERHGSRVSQAIETLGKYISKLLKEEVS